MTVMLQIKWSALITNTLTERGASLISCFCEPPWSPKWLKSLKKPLKMQFANILNEEDSKCRGGIFMTWVCIPLVQ
jgi:hypothetical protein